MAKQEESKDLMVLPEFTFEISEAVSIVKENIGGGDVSPFDLDRVKVPAGGTTLWEIPSLSGEAENVQEIRGIIIFHKDVRSYWEEDYTGEGVPPDCFSDDNMIGIGNPGGVCKSCPLAQWGSTRKEKSNSKACKEQKMIFLIREEDGNFNGFLPLLITVPPTSIKFIKKFMLGLAGKGVKYPYAYVGLKLNKTKNSQGTQYSEIVPRLIMIETDPKKRAIIDTLAQSMRNALESVSVADNENPQKEDDF